MGFLSICRVFAGTPGGVLTGSVGLCTVVDKGLCAPTHVFHAGLTSFGGPKLLQ